MSSPRNCQPGPPGTISGAFPAALALPLQAKEAKEALSAKQQQIERLKQHAFLEAQLQLNQRDHWMTTAVAHHSTKAFPCSYQ